MYVKCTIGMCYWIMYKETSIVYQQHKSMIYPCNYVILSIRDHQSIYSSILFIHLSIHSLLTTCTQKDNVIFTHTGFIRMYFIRCS